MHNPTRCVAAWHERIRTVASQAGIEERLLTLPVIQVLRGVWSVLYVVDDGIYRSAGAPGRWVEETFMPWVTDLLTRAVENWA
ncbi:hypothetical protein ARSEF4850_007831, partial [Beauveria asiatica]